VVSASIALIVVVSYAITAAIVTIVESVIAALNVMVLFAIYVDIACIAKKDIVTTYQVMQLSYS